MKNDEVVLQSFRKWYSGLPVHKPSAGPARGTIAAALVVLEHLKSQFVLDIGFHRAPGGAQLRGLSPSAVTRILKKFGETRPFLREGGRTNRGGPADIEKMLNTLRSHQLEKLPKRDQQRILFVLQKYLVERVRDFHNRQRIEVIYDPSKTTWQSVFDLLDKARARGRDGMVAQYLVGAKLAVRFKKTEIPNFSISAADDQLGRRGDFCLGNTIFHVTVAPMPAVYEKCKRNIEEGLRVYLLVPDRLLMAARQFANETAMGKICTESIESFVSGNIEELSEFEGGRVKSSFRELLEIYNRRVDEIETDKSIMIEIPPNLQR